MTPPPTEIYTLSLHDALPISRPLGGARVLARGIARTVRAAAADHEAVEAGAGLERSGSTNGARSEEHTSELQSPYDLVCRLLLEKKKKKYTNRHNVAT